MRLNKEFMLSFAIANIGYFLAFSQKGGESLGPFSYIVFTLTITELIYIFRTEGSSNMHYFRGVLIAFKYIIVAMLYFSIYYLANKFIGIRLPI